jgi:hypothetical protein
MAFYTSGTRFISFAVYDDVVQRDSRLFESNEILTENITDDLLALASQRILTSLKNTDWWREYNFRRNTSLQNDLRQVPAVDPFNIDGLEQEFKDLNVYLCLSEYLLPRVADFGNPESAEVQKIKHYKESYEDLLRAVIEDGSWYDYSGNGTISVDEREPAKVNQVRTR